MCVFCVHAHVQLGIPEDNHSCHSSGAIHLVLSQGLSVDWNSPHSLDWLAGSVSLALGC